jgi:hypothetical protein
MPDSNDRHGQTSTEDDAFIAGARRLGETLKGHPFVLGFLAIFAAAAIFLLGVRVGEIAYLAFDGEGMMAIVFGATFVTVLVVIIGIGVVLDRRQRTRDTATGPLTDEQRDRLQAYGQPASPLVRWYQPAAVAVFIALAAPGALLLDTPWGSLWVLAVLIANPLPRRLRAQGHVLTTRDLGFAIPGLSPWPSIAVSALAATTGMGIAVLLWAEALDTTLATIVTYTALTTVIIGGGLAVDRHQRRHVTRLLDAHTT